ncbi:MAG TPA: ATP-binding cassette domain-containing protein [Candidatus Caldiarchaeum subterraneum]|uniref:ATP-binding cassette domain-containing protein n=1 Tax=Caldiarchaeum subterraneum TaxID=311458 RepID=A0A833E9R6_CALS0|nr:ATP-binding cassette domain-containing protein [Candidatus Caldarchaeum subterraneum]
MTNLLEARDIWFSYDGRNYIIKGISMTIGSGRMYMIFGRSGVGKTTLLKLFKGILKPVRGEIRYKERTIINNAQVRRDSYSAIGYIPQGFGVINNLTVLDNVIVGALSRVSTLSSLIGRFPEHEVKKAEEILRMLKIHDLCYTKVSRISGGQRQRVAIARALMQNPEIILADEFISQLDPVTSLEVLNDFKRLAEQRKIGVVITTHDIQLAPSYADEVLVMRGGEIVFRAVHGMIDERDLVSAMR